MKPLLALTALLLASCATTTQQAAPRDCNELQRTRFMVATAGIQDADMLQSLRANYEQSQACRLDGDE